MEKLRSRRLLIALTGLSAVVACLVMFAGLLDDARAGGNLAGWDSPLSMFIVAHRNPAVTNVFVLLTRVGGTTHMAILALLAAAVVAWRLDRLRPVWVICAGFLAVQVAVTAVKLLVERARPSGGIVSAHGYSFPSAHAALSLVVFTLIAWLASELTTSRRVHVAMWVAAAVCAFGVGVSRIYLGVHYLSDVLAGWVLAIGLLAVLLTLLTVAQPPARRGDSTAA